MYDVSYLCVSCVVCVLCVVCCVLCVVYCVSCICVCVCVCACACACVQDLCKKANQKLHALARLSNYIDPIKLQLIIDAFIATAQKSGSIL